MSESHDAPDDRRPAGDAPPREGDFFRTLAEAISDATLVIDEQSAILYANAAVERVFGYQPGELHGRALSTLMPDRFRDRHEAGLGHYLATGERRIGWHGIELPGLHRSGKEIPLEISFGETRADGRRVFVGTVRDTTRRKRAVRRIAAQHAVTSVLAEADAPDRTIPKILEAVCASLDWQFGALWRVDRSGAALTCEHVWHPESPELERFAKICLETALPRGVGLPGRVLAGGEATWVVDITDDPNFLRSSAASRAGLHSGFAFPVMLDGRAFVVLEFFTRDRPEADPGLLEMMADLGTPIGQFLARARAEAERNLALVSERDARQAAEEKQGRMRFLAEASATLAASLDYEATLAQLARLAVPTLADVCIVDVVREDGRLRHVAVESSDPEVAPIIRDLQQRYPPDPNVPFSVGRVLRTGKSYLLSEVAESHLSVFCRDDEHREAIRRLGVRSTIAVPLAARGQSLGALTLLMTGSGRRFTVLDLETAGDLAGRSALHIDNLRLYREAQQAGRLKDEFLAATSHELRTPLTLMLGWVTLLRRRAIDPRTLARGLEAIEHAARSQVELVEQLLAATRLFGGEVSLEMKRVDLNVVAGIALDAVRPHAEAKRIHLRIGLAPTPLFVTGDADGLRRVIWNLLGNAVKFTPEGGRVDLNLERFDGFAGLTVSDTGQGIDAEFLPFVFEPFRQADGSTTRRHGGLGLGLAVVREVVTLHGGTVEASSEGSEGGASFRLRIPLAETVDRDSPAGPGSTTTGDSDASSPPAGMLEGRRVLFVDDEVGTHQLFALGLGAHGAEVQARASAAEALAALEQFRPDIIISDIGMPGEDGYVLIRQLRSRSADQGGQIPAIALTAYASYDDRALALEAGFDAHLTKPIGPDELATAVASLLEESRRKGSLGKAGRAVEVE